MRLTKISPWSSGSYSPPRKIEPAGAATTKPPDASGEASSEQASSEDPGADLPSEAPPSHALDITI